MPAHQRAVDTVFRALADPTRRRVMERLSKKPASVTELAEPFDMALPSFLQHMKVLEGCGLVRSRKLGRVRTYRVVPRRLNVAEGWLAKQRSVWSQRLDQLDDYLAVMKEDES